MKNLSTPITKFMADNRSKSMNRQTKYSFLSRKNSELLNNVKLELDKEKQNFTKKGKFPRKGNS